ncbi:MAG: TonB-dependent receptor plug domain-containing protein [Candidatus Latescibacteria bacterium]|nr:TonB-dependent receptor plug domain-containing protein [Candidatus Latescibacterota bacterium]
MFNKYLLLIVLGILFYISATVTVAQNRTYTLKGIVVTDDDVPVGEASVSLSPTGNSVTTDSNGGFVIKSLGTDKYVLTVSLPSLGFEDSRTIISIPRTDDAPLKIVLSRKSYTVDEVVVLSNPGEKTQKTENSPSFVTIVERSEFEKDAVSVTDVIMQTPSANISVMGGLGDYSEVSLRGSFSNQVQIYLDGMLLNESVGGAVNLSTIPLSQVESIEIWRSGAPGNIGGDAMGGVVNIRTREITVPHKTVTFGYGSFDTFTTSALVNVPYRMSKFHFTADFSSSENDFSYKSDNGTVYNEDDDYQAKRSNDEYRSVNVLGKYSTVFSNNSLIELSDHVLTSDKNIPGPDNIRTAYASLKSKKNLFQAKLSTKPFLHDIFEFNPTLYHIFNHEHYEDLQGRIGWGMQNNIYETNTYTILLPFTARAGKYAVFSFTPTARHESFRPEQKLQAYAPLSCDREQFSIINDFVLNVPGDRLIITGNLRRDRYFSSFDGQPSALNINTPSSKFNHLTNSQAGTRLNLFEGIIIQANYGDIQRVPGFLELFGDRGGTLSNPDLKPEHIFKWDIGGKFRIYKSSLPLYGSVEYAYFKNNFRDLIQWYNSDAGFISPENVGGSYVKGNEIVWNGNIFEHVRCSGNWTFQRSKVTKEKRSYYRDKELPNRPHNLGSIKIDYPIKKIIPFVKIHSKGGYYLDRANQDHKRYPGRTLYDLGVSWSFLNGKSTLNAQIKNITDIQTFDIQGMPKPGRSYMAAIVYSLK